MKSWFNTELKNDTLNISIHDEIGLWGVTAKDFIGAIDKAGPVNSIDVSIHSPGGSAFDGLAMYTRLKNHDAQVTTRVQGLAASAASIVFMAGDEREMPQDTWLMIHNAFGMAFGGAEDLRDYADLLDNITNTVINIYERHTDLSADDLRPMLAEETWIDASQAVQQGFATQAEDAMQVAALSQDFARHFQKVPPSLSNLKAEIEGLNTIKDFESWLRDAAGLTKGQAVAAVARAKAIIRQSDSDDGAGAEELNAMYDRLSGIGAKFGNRD